MEKPKQTPKVRLWISYILQGLVVIMFLMGAAMNLLQSEEAVKGAVEMGYPEQSIVYLGLVLLVSTLLYTIPKTSGFGAILLTGWLGGAVATHMIHQDPIFNTAFPLLFGIVMWLALWLRQEKVQQFLKI